MYDAAEAGVGGKRDRWGIEERYVRRGGTWVASFAWQGRPASAFRAGAPIEAGGGIHGPETKEVPSA